jgi:hypothetical protein
MYFYIFVWRSQNYLNDQVKISSYVPPRLLLPHSKTSTKSCDDGDTMQGFKKKRKLEQTKRTKHQLVQTKIYP